MKGIIVASLLSLFGLVFSSPARAQGTENGGGRIGPEVYTGTIINVGGPMVSTGFTLRIEGRTSDQEATAYRQILADRGQDDLLRSIYKNRLGYIAATGQTRRDLLVVREGQLDGQRRIIVAFERWQGFFELRGGYRSVDYPFSVMEIIIDANGKGTGTFIGLAQVKMARDTSSELLRLEIENFGSFPAKVMGVARRD